MRQVEWSNLCHDALDDVEKYYGGKDIADIIQSKVLQVCVFIYSLSGLRSNLSLLINLMMLFIGPAIERKR